jgi:hypothetical protein
MNVVKRIKYDANPSSWIVLVQWIEGVFYSKKHMKRI